MCMCTHMDVLILMNYNISSLDNIKSTLLIILYGADFVEHIRECKLCT